MADAAEIQRARELIAQAGASAAFTGAGVSTASGVPDFRGPEGLWTRFDPEEFTYQRFRKDPARFWELRAKLTRELRLDEVEPNPCHEALARAVQQGRVAGIITQNIDGLHQAAGVADEQVLEVHGTTRYARCTACSRREPIEQALDRVDGGELPPSCPQCGGVVKPDVILFGELLPQATLRRAQELAQRVDVLLVAGSSLRVHPAAGIPQITLEAGGEVIVVNGEPTPLDPQAAVVLHGQVEDVVPELFS